ncbi:hypothetical protein ACFL5I_00970 [Planctomycetota bacterium]
MENMKQSLETLWQAKMNCLPSEIMRRLELEPLYTRNKQAPRYLVSGLGADAMSAVFRQNIAEALRGKLFIDKPLNVFPDETFELVILLWSLSTEKPQAILSQVYRVLKRYGQCVLVTSFDSSPELPWAILKNALRVCQKQYQEKLQIYKSDLPQNAWQLRKIMSKIGLKDIQIWEDGVSYKYQDGNLLFNDLIRLSSGKIFHDSVASEIKINLRRKFCGLFDKMMDAAAEEVTNESTLGVEVVYSFAGAMGVK